MTRPRKTRRKWQPEDGLREFVTFTDWTEIAALLPDRRPADAKDALAAHGRRLWDRRAGRSRRVPAAQLRTFLIGLRATAGAAPDAGKAAILANWAREAERDLELANAYEAWADPDKWEFYYAVLRCYREWGGDLGTAKQYVPAPAVKFFCAVCVAVLGPDEAPKASSVWRIVEPFRHVQFADALMNITEAGRRAVAAWFRPY
jgi:hypothetical protein